jgi:hypothetical protein
VSQWKQLLLEAASALVRRGQQSPVKNQGQAKDVELCQQYCYAVAWRLRQVPA